MILVDGIRAEYTPHECQKTYARYERMRTQRPTVHKLDTCERFASYDYLFRVTPDSELDKIKNLTLDLHRHPPMGWARRPKPFLARSQPAVPTPPSGLAF